MKRSIVFIIVILVLGHSVQAGPVNLASWNALTLNFPGGQSAGNWIVSGDNLSVVQTINADPSFFLNNLNQTSYSMDGSWQVLTSSDNDFMGFVFGYQNSSNFYLFDWKQGNQSAYGANATAGMTIKKMTGGTGDGLVDLSLGEFWENQADLGDMTILDKNQGSGKGWANNILYDFHLDFNKTPGDIHIVVKQGATILWDTTVNDTTFSAGEFGFYNYSQQTVRYAGFEQTGGVIVPVPAPGAVLLAGLGVSMVGWMRKRKVIK